MENSCNILSSILKNSTGKMELSFKGKRNVFIRDEILYGYLNANKWMNNAYHSTGIFSQQ
jgi:hypothetical protein